jgi:hypothetical protein
MTVNLEWYVDPHVCFIRCRDRWGWSDLYESIGAAADIADSVAPTRIDTVLDLKHSRLLPDGPIITHLRNICLRSRSNQGVIALLGADRVVRSFVMMFDKVYPALAGRFLLADDAEEALALIHLHREQAANASLQPDETIPSRAMLEMSVTRHSRR